MDHGDDAGVLRIGPALALVQTVDFFTPIVDDPYLFGGISAANSLSDVYAMGGRPVSALNILCYPIGERDPDEVAGILLGGANKLKEAGVPLLGGHSVDDPEPKFGYAVTGLVHPDHVATNAGARPGDVILLTKPLGTGIITTAARNDACPPEPLQAACASMLQLNRPASEAMQRAGIGPDAPVSAATDITGFGLLGHLLHLAIASHVTVELDSGSLPALPGALQLAQEGETRGGRENLEYVEGSIQVLAGAYSANLPLLTDPQTSGGLAICVREADAADLDVLLKDRHVETRARIGRVVQREDRAIRVL